jgi:hypothetical protein
MFACRSGGWWHGFAKGMVGDVLQEIKHREDKLLKGDLRLVPQLKDWTIKASVCRWMKVYVNDLTQDSPEYLEGERGAVEGKHPRKFLGGIKVRGVLWHMYENDRLKETSGQLLFCAKGFFKTIFNSQYGRVTGPATGNFWATDAIRSLMGGYCFKCSEAALSISNTDALTRQKGNSYAPLANLHNRRGNLPFLSGANLIFCHFRPSIQSRRHPRRLWSVPARKITSSFDELLYT